MYAGGHAVFEAQDGRWALCFERVLPFAPARVWSALTSHDQLSDWHPTPFELEARVGGLVSYRSSPQTPELPQGRVLASEPPRLLAYSWGQDELRWELRGEDESCVLRLTHIFDDRFKAARDAAGWHLCLGALSRSLEGDPLPQRGSVPRLPAGWEELNAYYEERFEIPREQATPPPSL
jgi:uncharacterized protein YndB with AHSA1/START domain